MGCQGRCFNIIAAGFDSYGRFVARHPWWFIIVPVLVCAGLGVGIMKMTSESDLETLYVPVNSQAKHDRDRINELFPDKSGSDFYIQNLARLNMYGDVIIKAKDGRDLLKSQETVDEIQAIIDEIKQISFEENGTSVGYEDVCAIRNGFCFISGSFLTDNYFLRRYKSGQISYPVFYNRYDYPIDISFTVNGVSENGTLKSVSAVKIVFNLRQTPRERSSKWEEKFIEKMSNISTNLTELVYSASTSLDTELESNTKQDIKWFSLSFTLMITYSSVVATSGNCVANRGHLARVGVVGVGLAILAAFGVCAFGLQFVNIVGVMPFLALGVGVDEMFVIMSEWAEHYSEPTNEDQMGMTLQKCGGSISIASLTDITAFLIGVSSKFISIRNFCAYTAVALAFSFLMHLTFFMGCLAIHGRRTRANRNFTTCLKVKENCNGGGLWKPPQRREDDESLCEKIPQRILAIPLSSKFMWFLKIAIIIAFMGYMGVSIWGIMNLRQGLILSNLVDADSYYHKYEAWNDENFKMVFPISLIFQDVDYINNNDVQDMQKLIDSILADYQMNNNSLVCWYHEYNKSVMFDTSDSESFIFGLETFLAYRPDLNNDIRFAKDGSIEAARCHMLSIDVPESAEQGALMLRLREITAESDLNVFVYSSPFIFFEQYVSVIPSTLQTMGIAVVCMFVITVVFMPHPVTVILVTLNLLSILVGILGFLYYWDLSLSSITMIHLIMSVGFSVDFSVHVCHGFISSESETRNQRTRDALRVSAAPILNGGLSSLIGICTLIGSQSYIFQSFFKIMVLVMTFGLAHSMLLLPVILSLIGPKIEHLDYSKSDIITTVPDTIKSNGEKKPPTRNGVNFANNAYINNGFDNGKHM